MCLSKEEQRPKVDFERATELLPYLEKDLAALDLAVDNYWKNFSRFTVKFLSLFHSPDEVAQPNPRHRFNKAAEKLELSHLIKLQELIADEEKFLKLLHRLLQNNERMHMAAGLLAAYIKYFQRSQAAEQPRHEIEAGPLKNSSPTHL